jgi:hypothetical protein
MSFRFRIIFGEPNASYPASSNNTTNQGFYYEAIRRTRFWWYFAPSLRPIRFTVCWPFTTIPPFSRMCSLVIRPRYQRSEETCRLTMHGIRRQRLQIPLKRPSTYQTSRRHAPTESKSRSASLVHCSDVTHDLGPHFSQAMFWFRNGHYLHLWRAVRVRPWGRLLAAIWIRSSP